MSMRFDAQAKKAGFVHCGVKFLQSKFLRLRITAVSQHGSAGKNLDVIDAVVGELTNYFAYLPRAIGLTVVEIPRQLNVRSKAGERAGATGNRNVRASDKHARANDVAAVDGVAQSDVAQGAISAHIAHRGESGLKHGAGIGHGLEYDLRSGLFELSHRLGV